MTLIRSPTYAASMTCRYDSFPTLTCEIPSSGGFPFSPICASMRRACLRSRSPGGRGGLVMSGLRDQSNGREERASAAVVLEPDRARAHEPRAGRDTEIDPPSADDEAAVAHEPRDVPRELRAGERERVAHLDERHAIARASVATRQHGRVRVGEPGQERVRSERPRLEPQPRAPRRR